LINFAGDGVLALWSFEASGDMEIDKKRMLEVNHMAVQCSLYLQEQLSDFRVDIPKNNINSTKSSCIYLKTHTGLGSGEVKVYYIGMSFQNSCRYNS
jgi:hypothetical protein